MSTNSMTPQGGTASRGTMSTTEKVGWVVSGLLIAFLLIGGLVELLIVDAADSNVVDLGYPESTVAWINIALVICAVLCAIPRTALLGAILLTGYFGGATATNVRLEDPWFLLPIAVGVLVWVGLAMRDARTRTFLQQALDPR